MDHTHQSPGGTSRLKQPTKHSFPRRRPTASTTTREADVKENFNPAGARSSAQAEAGARLATASKRMSVPARNTVGITAPMARRIPERTAGLPHPREIPLPRTVESSATSELAGSQQKFIEALQRQCQNMSSDVEVLRDNLRKEESKSKALSMDLINKQAQIETLRRDCEDRIRQAHLEVLSQPAHLPQSFDNVSELKTKLEDAMMKVALLEADKNLVEITANQDSVVREESEKTIQVMEKTLNSTMTERDELLDSYDALKNDRSSLQRSLDTLSADLKAETAKLSIVQEREHQAEKRVQDKTTEVNRLVDERQQVVEQLNQMQEQKSMVERQLRQESAEEKARLEETLNTAETKIAALQDAEASLRKEVAIARDDLTASSRLSDSLKTSIATQEVAAIGLKAEKAALEVKLSSTEVHRDELSVEIVELRTRLDSQLSYIGELDVQMRKDEDLRRKLHNTVQELKGNIRVFCRVRPQLSHDQGKAEVFKIDERKGEIVAEHLKSPSLRRESTSTQKWQFNFDHVFGPEASQFDVFQEISAVAQSALDGYRVCLFAYGQTGSGKTHTMIGDAQQGSRNSGMIPLSIYKIFDQARSLEAHGWRFSMKASFLEIYNETINDLLAIPSASATPKKYEVKQERDSKEVYVTDLVVESVNSPDEVHTLLNRAMKNRSTASTAMNDRSSRSHSVFQLRINGENSLSGESLEGQLNLIDLAGSERLNSTQSVGDRLKETKHINKSLSSLGDVIAALANKEKHIPYRNSKLTYVLQDSLGGNCKTLMFVNISPDAESFQESLCSLRFAAKVNRCDISTARRSAKVSLGA